MRRLGHDRGQLVSAAWALAMSWERLWSGPFFMASRSPAERRHWQDEEDDRRHRVEDDQL